MGDLFVVGHGRLLDGEVFLPAGRRIHFYARKHTGLPLTLAVAVVNSAGGTGPLWSAGSARHSARCRNVLVSPLGDHERMVLSSASCSVPVICVGDSAVPVRAIGLRLCETPSACTAARAHACGGWLDVLAGRADDLHFVTCLLHNDDDVSRATQHTGREERERLRGWRGVLPSALRPDPGRRTGELKAELDWMASRFARLPFAAQEKLFDSWATEDGHPTATQAMMLGHDVVEQWAAVRGARSVLAEAGMFSLTAYLTTLDQREQAVCRRDPSVRHAVDKANRWLNHWTDPRHAHPEKAAEAWRELDQADRIGLAHAEPALASRMAMWTADFPSGMTPRRAAQLVDEHNLSVLAAAPLGVALPAALIGEAVVLAPSSIATEHDESGFETGTGGALRRYVRSLRQGDTELTPVDAGAGLVLAGAVSGPTAEYVRRLAASAWPDIAHTVAHHDLRTVHDMWVLRSVNSDVLDAVAKLNRALAVAAPPEEVNLALAAAEEALDARDTFADTLSRWSSTVIDDVTAWWDRAMNFVLTAQETGRIDLAGLPEATLRLTTAFLLSDGAAQAVERADLLTEDLHDAWHRVATTPDATTTADAHSALREWCEVVPGAVALALTELRRTPDDLATAAHDTATLMGRLREVRS
ncbi:hypothetical protein [Lentzea sp. E54]|uniref:hypothetical protein n=1 Tax=Lentzea xerophila TaxID=3435883 RepID=UPI003DA29D49